MTAFVILRSETTKNLDFENSQTFNSKFLRVLCVLCGELLKNFRTQNGFALYGKIITQQEVCLDYTP